ncbi:MAG: hypothetical protein IJT34_08945, partial [Butyrivibrio sp.]|nr:hypothetical protein [Butyrivibrio sp.]
MRIKEGKRIIQALAVILLLFVLFGLQRFQAGSETGVLPERIMDDKYRTCYEIFVYSFADSDGDGIGDLRGVLEHLDYICDGDPSTDTDLGCNEIWLTPVCPSPTYHKYDVTDYCDIDPQYGTMTDY